MTAEVQPSRPRGRPRSQASEDAILNATLKLLLREAITRSR